MAGNIKAKKKKIGKSKLSRKPSATQDIREKRAVDLPSFLKEFDALLDKKDFTTPQTMLDSLIGLKKWQRLNLQ